jgi:hypothetical protein
MLSPIFIFINQKTFNAGSFCTLNIALFIPDKNRFSSSDTMFSYTFLCQQRTRLPAQASTKIGMMRTIIHFGDLASGLFNGALFIVWNASPTS